LSDWMLLGTIAAALIALTASYTRLNFRMHPIAVLLLAAAVLVPPMYTTRNVLNTDIENFRLTGDLVRSRTYVYSEPWAFFPFHPYLPLQMFISAAAAWLADVWDVTFSIALKSPNVAAAAATAMLLLAAARRLHEPRVAWFAPVGFLLNPSLVEHTAYHGQFDTLPALLAFGAWGTVRFGDGERRVTLSAALLGLGILAKTWPIALLPLLLLHLNGGVRQRAVYAGIALAVPALATASYVLAMDGSFRDLWRTVGQYRGIIGLSGYSMILKELPGSSAEVEARRIWVAEHGRVVFYAGVLATLGAVVAARPKLESAITTVLVSACVFAPAATPSYFIWVLPFALIANERVFPALYGVTAVVARCSVVCYDHLWQWPPDWWAGRAWYVGAAAWGIMVVWLVWLLCGLGRAVWSERRARAERDGRAGLALAGEPP
jgi:glycosyl transferase family 87